MKYSETFGKIHESVPSPMTKTDKQLQREDHTPPILGSWRKLYLLVLGNLALLIAVFYLLTKYYE